MPETAACSRRRVEARDKGFERRPNDWPYILVKRAGKASALERQIATKWNQTDLGQPLFGLFLGHIANDHRRRSAIFVQICYHLDVLAEGPNLAI